MPKSLGKRLDDQSIAVKKTVEEKVAETLKLVEETPNMQNNNLENTNTDGTWRSYEIGFNHGDPDE